jgi:hydroxypyruvate isomerase
MMFNEVSFLDRIDMAAQAGFEAVECLFPYAEPASRLAARLRAAGLTQVLFNAPPGNWEGGDRGLAALPHRRDEFRQSLARALDYAATLGCPRLHVMAGIPGAGSSPDRCRGHYIESLVYAAEQAAGQNVTILIEPLNSFDVPGYFLNSIGQAAAVIAEAGQPNLALQFDAYHVQMSQGRIVETFRLNLSMIGHIQISGVPGRCEPDSEQEINYPFLFAAIDGSGYSGWVGCEYRPRGTTAAGLGWLAPWRSTG